jgi:hypothetical protein
MSDLAASPGDNTANGRLGSEDEFWTRIPLEEIRPGDRFNTFRRMAGQIQVDFGRTAVRVVRDDERIRWIVTECGSVSPDDIKSVWRGHADTSQ